MGPHVVRRAPHPEGFIPVLYSEPPPAYKTKVLPTPCGTPLGGPLGYLEVIKRTVTCGVWGASEEEEGQMQTITIRPGKVSSHTARGEDIPKGTWFLSDKVLYVAKMRSDGEKYPFVSFPGSSSAALPPQAPTGYQVDSRFLNYEPVDVEIVVTRRSK